MTFQDYVSTHGSLTAQMYCRSNGITETTPRDVIFNDVSIARFIREEIEQLQRDYTKTLDVAYQIVIENIRNRKGE